MEFCVGAGHAGEIRRNGDGETSRTHFLSWEREAKRSGDGEAKAQARSCDSSGQWETVCAEDANE